MPDPDLPDLPELTGLRDLPVAPPPAAQIRRRGDQRRHRTQLLGVAGVAVVVALIVAPLAVLGRSTGSHPPPPIATHSSTPSPDPTPKAITDWTTHRTIPAWFPLGDGLPQQDPKTSDHARPGDVGAVKCAGSAVWSRRGTIDALWAQLDNGADHGEQLGLFLYPNPSAAQDAIASVKQKVAACVSADGHGGPDRYSAGVDGWSGGIQFGEAYATGDLAGYVFYAEGNALLVEEVEKSGVTVTNGTTQAASLVSSALESSNLLPGDMAYFANPAGTEVFGPHAYGDLRLGMSYADAMATGGITPPAKWDSFHHLANGTQLCLSKKDGLMSIVAGNSLRTPEGIRVGSTRSELEAAYPGKMSKETAQWIVVIDAHTQWSFGIEGQLVQSVTLTSDAATCGG